MSLQNSPPASSFDSPDAVDTPAPYALNSQIVVGAVILLIVVVLFVLMLHMYVKWLARRSPGSHILNQGATPSAQPNTGLDKAAIAQLPTFVYMATSPVENSEAGKLDESSITMPAPECAVCLSEFQENEKGRMLPACKHVFHTECIDMWFFSHSTCPLCRTHVIPATLTETTSTGQPPEATEPSQDTTEGNSVTLHTVEHPSNVLVLGNQTEVDSSQEPVMSTSPSLQIGTGASALPQITIDIPAFEGDLIVNTSECLSAKCRLEQEADSSQPLKSPSLRASIKRMLSRQSSRQKNPSQEGNEGSPK